VALVKQEILTHTEHLSSPPMYNGIRVAQQLVFRVVYISMY
jgi:hypothetical protein